MAGQQHLDRLSAVDAGFLAQEKPNTHMHIGGLAIFEGEPPGLDEFLAHIESRLHLVPRYRQKLAVPPLETGRPLWVDDPSFNLAYHVRHTALPEPGDEEALLALAARVFSQRLDRSKPLWELWLVEGLNDGGNSPCSRRPTTRWSTASRASTSPACCSTSRPTASTRTAPSRGCPSPSRRAPSSPRAG